MRENKDIAGGITGKKRIKIIVSGGGTGGHIFPAISIADELKREINAEILFVGAEGRMEMTRVPEAGFKIIGLPVVGFDRKKPWRNINVIFKLFKSISLSRKILREFKPEIVIGVGGYASGPMLKAAQKRNIPTLIQEQNSYAGVTNKLLAKKAEKICVAYDGMHRFFPADRIIKTGNPIRSQILVTGKNRKEALESFGLINDKKTQLVVGGSLGALTINESLEKGLKKLVAGGIQVIWQTGKNFGNRGIEAAKGLKGVVVTPFISDMASAYKGADLIISRAGAASISEIQALGKAAILVPSPNVAEDHQTHNAMALVKKDAAIMIKDSEAREKLVDTALHLLSDSDKLMELGKNAAKDGITDSAQRICHEVIEILSRQKNG